MNAALSKVRQMFSAMLSKLSSGPGDSPRDADQEIAVGARRIIWIIGGALCAFIAWAAIFDLDVASRGVGEVVPAGQVKRIQHLEGGIVREIFVTEGEKVTAGQPLMELEGTASQAETAELSSRLAALRIKMIRLRAQLGRDREVQFPAELTREYSAQITAARELFFSEMERLKTSSSSQTHKVSQRRAEIDEMTSRIAQLADRKKLLAEQVAISKKLLDEGLTNQY